MDQRRQYLHSKLILLKCNCQGGAIAYILEEIDLTDCEPYKGFNSSRFVVTSDVVELYKEELKRSSMRAKIQITDHIIRRSAYCPKKLIHDGCALKLAVHDLFPTAHVFEGFLGFTDRNGYEVTVDLPEEATEFIQIWDNLTPEQRLNLSPTEITLDLPEDAVNAIGGPDYVKWVLRTSQNIKAA